MTLQISPEEATQFPREIVWSSPEPGGSGRLVADDGVLWLETGHAWPILQLPGVPQGPVNIRGLSEGDPIFLSGSPAARGGDVQLRIDDVRLGSDDPEANIVAAWPQFDYADLVVKAHLRDGALRSVTEPLDLPELDDAPAMKLTYSSDHLEIRHAAGTQLSAFETQMDGLQRLLTFSSQQAAVRRRLTVESVDGVLIQVFRGTAVEPRPIRSVDYRDFPLRMAGVGTQLAIERWWTALDKLRPIPHLLAALRYRAGYLESDFLFLATCVDRLSAAWTSESGPLTTTQLAALEGAAADLGIDDFQFDNRAVFIARARALAQMLDAEVWTALHVDREAWLASVRRQRNLVAHSVEQRPVHRRFLTGLGLPALRAATDAAITMIVAQHLGADDSALLRTAERQYVLRLSRFVAGTLVLTNEGFEDRLDDA